MSGGSSDLGGVGLMLFEKQITPVVFSYVFRMKQ